MTTGNWYDERSKPFSLPQVKVDGGGFASARESVKVSGDAAPQVNNTEERS